jgi:Tol biopolymer transport system component
MVTARPSPDGQTFAFVSQAGGIDQVFLMLASGGEPLQLTNDEGDKFVDAFSSDSREVYYGRFFGHEEVWAVPTLGGGPRRVASAGYVVPSPDGNDIYFWQNDKRAIFRAGKSGLNEELVYKSEDTSWYCTPLLVFPNGNDLLAIAPQTGSDDVRIYKISLTTHAVDDLGKVSVSENGTPFDITWAEPGISVLFSRAVNGLTNIWKYSLQDRSLTQVTFGPGPDYSPATDPRGKGIYYVNGRPSGFLTTYRVQSKQPTDLASDDATQPAISPDGKRVMYVAYPAPPRAEVWVSDTGGSNKVKIATGENLATARWAPDNFHLLFSQGPIVYIVGADGRGLRQLPSLGGMLISDAVWSPDQKLIYVSTLENAESTSTTWEWSDGSNPEKLVEKCGAAFDADPGGEYLLAVITNGEKTGIYQVSIFERKCVPLLPGVVTSGAIFARDGKSFLYAIASPGGVTIYRQPWRGGKVIGQPQVALKVPFSFPLQYSGNAYDFSKDLSTIVYARPGGHADLYLLSQK